MCLIKFPQVCLPIPGMSPQFPMCVYLDLGNIPNSPVSRLWPALIPLFLRSVYTDLGGFPKSSSVSTLTRDVSLIAHVICWLVFPWYPRVSPLIPKEVSHIRGLSPFAWPVFLIPQLCLPWHWMFPLFLRLVCFSLDFLNYPSVYTDLECPPYFPGVSTLTSDVSLIP